jgi:hypothetical protein
MEGPEQYCIGGVGGALLMLLAIGLGRLLATAL